MIQTENDLVKIFTDLVATTAGVVSLNTNDEPEVQPAIKIEFLDQNKINVNVSVIIDRNASITNVSKLIYDVINFSAKKEKKTLVHLDLEIKGVR